MGAQIGVLVLLAIVSLGTSWLWGYHEGRQTGAFYLLRQYSEASEREAARDEQTETDMARDRVCNEIRHYKFSIAKDLDENTQICGWSDIDGRERSN